LFCHWFFYSSVNAAAAALIQNESDSVVAKQPENATKAFGFHISVFSVLYLTSVYSFNHLGAISN